MMEKLDYKLELKLNIGIIFRTVRIYVKGGFDVIIDFNICWGVDRGVSCGVCKGVYGKINM